MSSRDVVLGRIRSALAGAPAAGPIPREYAPAGRLRPGSVEVIDLLVDRLVDYRASVHRVTGAADTAGIAAAVDAALGDATTVVVPAGLPGHLRRAAGASGRVVTVDDTTLTAYDLDRIDAVVTGARVAIADTGTIILDAGPDQGRRAITLVPDRHVVVLSAGQVVQSVPEGLAVLTPTVPITLISGPSATSDIELSRVEGVHGPRILHVVIV